MFTTHSKFGIGKITGETELTYTVYFEEIDAVKNPLKSTTKVYATIEDAENGLKMKVQNKVAEQIKEAVETERILREGAIASNWLAAKNRENAMNNLPSSMR
jgi:hypothetical protein